MERVSWIIAKDRILHGGAIIVKVSREDCSPCKMMSPILERTADRMGVPVVEVMVEDNPDLVVEMGISSVPVTLAFCKGNLAEKLVGSYPESKVAAWLDGYLNIGS